MRRALVVAAAIAVTAGMARAQPIDAPGDETGYAPIYGIAPFEDGGDGGRRSLRGGDTPWQGGLNAFFYPGDHDPQYGSDGRVADVDDFAAAYGCKPIWNAKTGRYIPGCN